MGHRHVFSPSYMFETEDDQRWNLAEHPCAHIAQNDAAESSSLAYPADNMSIGAQYASHCNLAPVSDIHSSSSAHITQNSYYQQDTVGPSDLPTDSSSLRGFYTVPESYRNTASSSSYSEHPYPEDDSFSVRTSNRRWQYKRKSPCVPSGCERVANRYNNDDGSSSDSWKETPNTDFHTRWDYPNMKPGHGSCSLSLGGESFIRNVRSRTALDSEANLPRAPSSNDYYTTSPPMDVSSPEHLLDQRLNGTHREWNPTHMPSNHDHGSLGHELNPLHVGSSNSSTSVESPRPNGIISRSNDNAQNFQGTSVQSVTGTHINYIQRSAPTFRASSSNFQLGHTIVSDERLPLARDSYSSQHPRTSSTIAWRSSYHNRRTRMSIERYQPYSEEEYFHDLPDPEGLMIMDRSALYGSRNPFDNHRDMRLDIDDMGYEELLALGERIGSVSTGLSDDLISKVLRESIYCSSDQIQDDGTCVICLEEYANMDDVGMLKDCRHDFHVGCIKKWLSMKNLCPICKSEPMKPPK